MAMDAPSGKEPKFTRINPAQACITCESVVEQNLSCFTPTGSWPAIPSAGSYEGANDCCFNLGDTQAPELVISRRKSSFVGTHPKKRLSGDRSPSIVVSTRHKRKQVLEVPMLSVLVSSA